MLKGRSLGVAQKSKGFRRRRKKKITRKKWGVKQPQKGKKESLRGYLE